MAQGADPRIIAIAAGDPFDVKTWSGSSHWLLSALRKRGVLDGAIDAWPPGVDVVARLGSWNADRNRWRQRCWHVAARMVKEMQTRLERR